MVRGHSSFDSFLQFFCSVKCGLTLLGLVGAAVVLGTVILQRPMAEEGQIEKVYAPQTIRLLDFFGLFDVFHAWWFILLLGLLGASIAMVSLERFPQAWRFFSRPHVLADEWFVRNQPVRREIPIGSRSAQDALSVAAEKFRNLGLRPRPEALAKGTLYVERHRIARLAPYVVHLSLLIIFAGGIVDGIWGFRGFLRLGPGMKSQQLEPLSPNSPPRRLPFTVRCDGAGMEKYADGSPRQYWSRLVIEDNGREVLQKQIFVNEPLTYKGIRFFQSSYGSTGEPSKLVIEASWPGKERTPQTVTLQPGEQVSLGDTGVKIELASFVPDFVLRGNELDTRSNDPNNPAVQLHVSEPGGRRFAVWFFPKFPQMNFPGDFPITFQLRDVEMGYFTGLQVAKQPGKWLIWGGCLLLSCGLVLALYMVHIRIWGVVGKDVRGRPVLLLGGQPSKYRESFEARFNHLAEGLEESLRTAKSESPQLERLSA